MKTDNSHENSELMLPPVKGVQMNYQSLNFEPLNYKNLCQIMNRKHQWKY